MGTTSKALTLLTHFNRSRARIGLSDMARLSGMNKATVHRLLSELAHHGFVEQMGAGREYRLGPALLHLAALRDHHVPVRDMALQTLTALSDLTGETAHMSLLNGEVLSSYAFTYSAAHSTMVTMEDAERLDLHATGSGLAVLAHSPEAFIDRALSRPLPPRTRQTKTDPEHIRALLPTIRAQGFAVSISGYEQDVHSIAAPIFNEQSQCFGAIAVAAPVGRMTDELKQATRAAILRHANELTRLLGGFPPDTYPNSLRNEPARTGG